MVQGVPEHLRHERESTKPNRVFRTVVTMWTVKKVVKEVERAR